MNEIKTFDDLAKRDIELNEQIKRELLENRDAVQFELKMRWKTEWYQQQVYNIFHWITEWYKKDDVLNTNNLIQWQQ